MQIVIDINELDFEVIKEVNELGGEWKTDIAGKCMKAIAKGIPLPKEHGDLIDRDTLECDSEYDFYSDGYIAYSKSQIMSAQAIIKADKEET